MCFSLYENDHIIQIIMGISQAKKISKDFSTDKNNKIDNSYNQ
jgi:hypothetical protein